MVKRRTRLKVGDIVSWRANKKTFTGKVVKLKPRIAPGAKAGVRIKKETYYPMVRLTKKRKRRTKK